jgi:hypothetical protein
MTFQTTCQKWLDIPRCSPPSTADRTVNDKAAEKHRAARLAAPLDLGSCCSAKVAPSRIYQVLPQHSAERRKLFMNATA